MQLLHPFLYFYKQSITRILFHNRYFDSIQGVSRQHLLQSLNLLDL